MITNSIEKINKKYDEKEPELSITEYTAAIPPSNDDTINSSNKELQLTKKLQDSKTIDLNTISDTISIINEEIPQKAIIDQRASVRLNAHIHPQIDESLQNLDSFKPTSEYTAAAYLGYTPDKQSLKLQEWGTLEKYIRKNIKRKLNSSVLNELEKSYVTLNKNMKSNVSTEVFKERKSSTSELLFAPGYHIEGDSNFYDYHIRGAILPSNLVTNLKNNLNHVINQIDYLAPVNPNITIDNETYNVDIEKTKVNINMRNETNTITHSSTNNTILTPQKDNK
jgi:hypothetical protein